MGTKEWIYRSDEYQDEVGIYQELTFDTENTNPATISIKNPVNFSVSYETNVDGKTFGELTAEITAEEFDRIAIAWCKHRKLQGTHTIS